MTGKYTREWLVDAPWGKIAMISWGDPKNPPVLLLHGYLDTVATFTYLVEKLPTNFYYVGFDIPGHGKSDPFHRGVLITKLHIVESIRVVVQSMGWPTFTYLAHSMCYFMGLCYNHFYPGHIEKMIFLDPKPALAWYYVLEYHTHRWFKLVYTRYYKNYETKQKPQKREMWIGAISSARKLSKEQTETVLSRSLTPTENNMYELSWEPRAKVLAEVHLSVDILQKIMTTDIPPTLIVNATEYGDFVRTPNSEQFGADLLKEWVEKVKTIQQVTVTGHHDFHITNPEAIAKEINIFLNPDADVKNIAIGRSSKL